MATDEKTVVLLPCAICGRTFKCESLEKHITICEKSAAKKRKPFDSSKQRIRGTELEDFLPKETQKKRMHEDKNKLNDSWKDTHNDFIKTIRAARGDTNETTNQRQNGTTTTTATVQPGPPTRSNEKGLCPTCNRQFGIKAYDRHVAWCKDRITYVPPTNPSTNVAKERLDARMKYRAPALKNRRITNREKYSPNKNHPPSITSSPGSFKTRENVSLPSCKISNSQNCLKPAAARKIGLGKNEGIIPSGPLKSRLSDRSFSGISQEYDPFLLAERQMNELLSDTCSSEQSFSTSPNSQKKKSPNYPLTHSSAFVKYPNQINLDNETEKRASLLAPPSEFDDLSTGFSSDSTETNSISREIFGDLELAKQKGNKNIINNNNINNSNNNSLPILGRKIIIDKSKALGKIIDDTIDFDLKKNSTKVLKPCVNRSNSVRASSAPKLPDRNNLTSCSKTSSRSTSQSDFNNKNNNYNNIADSNLSLNSLVSSDISFVKRSNSLFDDLVSSFEDDVSGSYPSLRSLLKNDSLSSSSPVQVQRERNGRLSDEDLSSPDSFNKKEHGKLSADSAYNSLNRKHFNNGRVNNDVISKLEEDNNLTQYDALSKMSRFCHQCGTKFPSTAKFCCECGIRRLAI